MFCEDKRYFLKLLHIHFYQTFILQTIIKIKIVHFYLHKYLITQPPQRRDFRKIIKFCLKSCGSHPSCARICCYKKSFETSPRAFEKMRGLSSHCVRKSWKLDSRTKMMNPDWCSKLWCCLLAVSLATKRERGEPNFWTPPGQTVFSWELNSQFFVVWRQNLLRVTFEEENIINFFVKTTFESDVIYNGTRI